MYDPVCIDKSEFANECLARAFYRDFDVLLLDDWGPEQLTAPQRRDLMEVIDERYGRKATIVTSLSATYAGTVK